MPKISKTTIDAELRNRIFINLIYGANALAEEMDYQKVNDRQYGIILTDASGVERYCRVGVIVAEEREDMTARELMAREIDEYNAKQASKAEKARARAEKAEKDKAKREKEKEA